MKKILAIILAAVLMVAVFAGCDSRGEEVSQPSEELAQTTEAVEEAVPADTIDEASEPDAEPEEVEQMVEEPASMPPMELPLSEELVTLTCYATFPNFMGPTSACGVETNDDLFAVQKAEEMLNVKIEWYHVNFMTYLEQFNVYIAGGEWTDMISGINAYSGGMAKAYEDGVVVDMRPMLEEHAPHFNYYMLNDPEDFKSRLTDDGVLGWIESYSSGEYKQGGLTVVTEFFEKWGNEAPATYDELHDYMLFAKNECGADIGLWFTNQCAEDVFSYGFGVEPFKATGTALPLYKNGDEVKCSLVSDEYRDYVEMLRQWYSEGLLYQEFAATTWNPNDNNITNNLYGGKLSVYNANAMNLANVTANISLTAISALTLEKGGTNHNEGSSSSASESIAITTQAEKPELCLKWIDFWFSDEGGEMYNYGVEGLSYEKADGEITYTEAAINNPYGDSVTNYIRTLSLLGKTPGVTYPDATLLTYSDDILGFINVWSTNIGDSENVYPAGAQLTVVESEESSTLSSDITTYATEQIPLFIMGELNMERDWDGYCAHIEQMGLFRLIEMYQDAYDRYQLR